jgi:hypothetical protein
MNEDVQQLENQRAQLYQQLSTFDDFRLGTISETYTRCGKKNCACADKSHSGHIRYLWNTTRLGKSVAHHLRLGPEMEQVYKQMEEGHRFQTWSREVLELNEKICRLRPVPDGTDQKKITDLKKKFLRIFLLKRRKRLKV